VATAKPTRSKPKVKGPVRRQGGKRNVNPWDAAKELPVIRGNWMYRPADLEPGVKFFVLMLERLGCETVFSCEGHPDGFYVLFRGTEAAARAVASCRFFDVRVVDYRHSAEPEFASMTDAWRLSPWGGDRPGYWSNYPDPEAARVSFFRRAAESWVKEFGPLGR
jgi:hypothetical protein